MPRLYTIVAELTYSWLESRLPEQGRRGQQYQDEAPFQAPTDGMKKSR